MRISFISCGVIQNCWICVLLGYGLLISVHSALKENSIETVKILLCIKSSWSPVTEEFFLMQRVFNNQQ